MGRLLLCLVLILCHLGVLVVVRRVVVALIVRIVAAGVGVRAFIRLPLPGVPVEVGEGFGIVADHGVEIERLRIGQVGVGHGSGDRGPVGGEPAAEARRVVASAEVVVAGFGVAFLAFEFVILRARVRNDVLTAKGIEVGAVRGIPV